MIGRDPKFWTGLKKFKLGFDLWKVTQELGFDHMILTKGPAYSTASWTGKAEWVQQNIGVDQPMTVTTDKGLVYGRVLVDDWIPYGESWLKFRPRGLLVLPAHPWNEGFSHPQAIRYDGTNMDEVRARIIQARDQGQEPS